MTDKDVGNPLETGDMYSTAFQFYSHINASVDPRTGMYGASVEISSGEGNRLRGPNFPFRISFSALEFGVDQGFGDGWRMALTEVDLVSRIVTLSSGDSHRYGGLLPGEPATFPDRKLDSFALIRPGTSNDVVIEHITGVIEHLSLIPGSSRYLRPVRIVNPSGDAIELIWELVPATGRYCLTRVIDDEGETLLDIHYTRTEVIMDVHLGHTSLTMQLELSGSVLRRVRVPLIGQLNAKPTSAEDEAVWEFAYRSPVNGLRLLDYVVSPDGIRENADYDMAALRLPSGAPMTSMPAVTQLTRRRMSDQKVIQRSTYSYSRFNQSNFYGHPVVTSWENRSDQLLHLIGDGTFRYGCTETRYDGNVPVATIDRDYNQFHLMTMETTTRGSVVNEVVTQYGALPNTPFENQPKAFQLPRRVTTRSYDERSPDIVQETYVESEYDSQGNVERRFDSATGMTQTFTYYPETGETESDNELCPPDPIGLVRRLKSTQTEPGPAGGPVRETRYLYTRVPVRNSARPFLRGREYYVQACEETSYSTEAGIERQLERNRQYFITDQGPQHGSLSSETHEQDGLEDVREFTYERDDTSNTLTKHTKHTTHDGIVVQTSETLYFLSGLVRAMRDAQGNLSEYDYDGLSRRVVEVVAPDESTYRAETRWNYQLSLVERWVERIGITGLPHRVHIDERGDVVRREEPLEDGTLAVVDEMEYDVFGQLTRQVDSDRLGERVIRRESRFEYDDWGERRLEVAPDGSESIAETDLVVLAGEEEVLSRTVRWQNDSDGNRTGWQASWTDAAGRAVRAETGDWAGDERIPRMTKRWEYDGLGRCVTTVESFEATDPVDASVRLVENVTRQTWDPYDRLATSTLPDGTSLRRTYAPGHDGSLLASLSVVPPGEVTERQLGTRTWDGLERLSSEQAGSLVSRHEYIPGQMSPDKKVMPDGSVVNMTYDSRLREVLVQSTLADARSHTQAVVTEAAYHRQLGLPSLVTTPQGEMEIELDYLGRMTRQTISLAGTSVRQCHVVVSPGGTVREKTGTDGVTRHFEYDDIGRPIGATDPDVTVELAYDALSRLQSRTTRSLGDRSVTQTYAYDAQGRISSVQLTHVDSAESLNRRLELIWRADDKLVGRLWYGEGEQLLRDERMDYDARGRLIDHLIDAEPGEHPQDEIGQPYVRQQFEHDCIDNLLKVTTTRLDGQVNVTDYGYDPVDIDRLVSVTNSLAGYPGHGTPLQLAYDANGNLIDDGQGRTLEWDGMSRLSSVTLPDARTIRYAHGPDSRVCQVATPESTTYRYREEGTIAFEVDDTTERRYIRSEGAVVAETRIAASIREVLLLGTDPQGSVITESSPS